MIKKLKFLYFIHRDTRYRIVRLVSSMPVTRSQKKQQRQLKQQEDAEYNTGSGEERQTTTSTATRRVKIITPSFAEASTRTYKVYSPKTKPKSGIKKTPEEAAAEVLVSLQYADDSDAVDAVDAHNAVHADAGDDTDAVSAACLNPMTPVSIYMYRIGIYNISQTIHYKTAYILYDKKSRMYHVYSIISNQIHAHDASASTSGSAEARTEFTLPLPKNTIQLKYKSYVEDTIANFIMTMIVPSNDHDYYIQDDIFGLVIQPDEFQKKAFGEDSCYYDIEDIVYDESSCETTSGFKAFMLVPSRHFWYWPAAAASYYNHADYRDNKYTPQTLNSVLMILSCSC